MRINSSALAPFVLAAGVVGLLAVARQAEAAFPGMNGKIAFVKGGICAMNADGSGLTQLINVSGFGPDYGPAWSPDGTRIAFHSYRAGGGATEVYVMNANGSGLTQLTNSPLIQDGDPAWSPDGTKIAFRNNFFGNHEILVMNADGSGPTRLTNNPAVDVNPAWSPDGTRIAFYTDRDGNGEIYVMNANGSGQTRLTNNPSFDARPTWSPDGTKIAFDTDRDSLNTEVYVMNADGSGQTRLTNNPSYDAEPSWSPDGTKIAFRTNRDGNHEIYVMNADGSGQTRLTNSTASDILPNWQTLPPLVISPASGSIVATTQGFDLTLLLTKPVVTVTGGTATLNGQNVSAQLLACLVPGSLASGRTFRCPNLRGATVGAGLYTLTVTLALSDGTMVSDTAFYTVVANSEP